VSTFSFAPNADVLATMRRAQSRLAGRVTEVMRTTIGDDKDMMDRVLAVYHDRFPDPEPDQRPAGDTKPRAGGDAWDEDAGSILRRSHY